MTWRVAYSLDKLLAQLNAMAPWRSKASDGAKGDPAHAARGQASDHNPWYGPGIVTARDFTHDPANGLDCHWLAETLVASKDPRIKYIIWDRRIIDSRPGKNRWKWMPYTAPGSNPHTKHLHLSVMDNASADDTRMWALTPHLPLDDDMSWQEPLTLRVDGKDITFKAWEWLTWANHYANQIPVLRSEVRELQGQVAELTNLVKTVLAGRE